MPYPKWHRRNRQERVLFCDRSSRMSRTIAVLYRFLYAGLLSRLPESAAISLGQSLLRRLPLDRLACFQLQDPGLVNCNGFQNPGLEGFRAAVASLPHRVPLIVSVAGESIDDYVKLVRELGTLGDLVEFNISSPNTKLVYEWSEKPSELATLLRELRRATTKPLIVKLSPDFAEVNEREIIPAALAAGVRIVNYGNTQKVADRRLSQSTGGLSGPDLFPATLENLRRTRRAFGADIEIIATGGVDSPEKAWQLLHEGANAIGYFTGFITRGPILARQILERLLDGR